MAKSKKRGGDKTHAKKVAARNQTIKNQKNAVQRMFEESMKRQLEELKKEYDKAKSVPQEPSDDEISDLDEVQNENENIEPTT
jgi:hypothetical protein